MPSPKLKLEKLNAYMGYSLRRAQLAFFDDFNRSCAEAGLKPAQFGTLVLIQANPKCKQSDVAKALGFQRTNFVAMIDELERRGLVLRTPSENDKRAYELTLTPAGERRYEEASALAQAHEERISKQIGMDKQQLIKALKKIWG